MSAHKKAVVDIRSQDVKIPDLERFRKVVSSNAPEKGTDPQELIMFSVRSRPYRYQGLEELKKELDIIPEGATYLYYTISFGLDVRISLYLDPDQPARVVIEGDEGWVEGMENVMKTQFGKGGGRYILHSKGGFIILYGSVLTIALIALTITSIVKGESDPVLTAVIIVVAGIMGIYISMIRMKDIHPANTVSFGRRRPWWLESLLNLAIVILGIVCTILAAELIGLIL